MFRSHPKSASYSVCWSAGSRIGRATLRRSSPVPARRSPSSVVAQCRRSRTIERLGGVVVDVQWRPKSRRLLGLQEREDPIGLVPARCVPGDRANSWSLGSLSGSWRSANVDVARLQGRVLNPREPCREPGAFRVGRNPYDEPGSPFSLGPGALRK
jgi:hypothetical protein